MTKKDDRKENTVRNEAQRLFDGFTIDALNQVVFNQGIWSEITKGYPGRIGRELLVKSRDLSAPVNASTRDAILYAARYHLDGNDHRRACVIACIRGVAFLSALPPRWFEHLLQRCGRPASRTGSWR